MTPTVQGLNCSFTSRRPNHLPVSPALTIVNQVWAFYPGDWRFSKIWEFLSRGFVIFQNLGTFIPVIGDFLGVGIFFVGWNIAPKSHHWDGTPSPKDFSLGSESQSSKSWDCVNGFVSDQNSQRVSHRTTLGLEFHGAVPGLLNFSESMIYSWKTQYSLYSFKMNPYCPSLNLRLSSVPGI